MSLRTACNHCNTPMKSRVKHQEIAGAPEDLRETANILHSPKAKQGHSPRRTRMSHRSGIAIHMSWGGKKVMQVSISNVLLLQKFYKKKKPFARRHQPAGVSEFSLKVCKMIKWS